MHALKVLRLERLMWFKSVPEQWPVTVVTAVRLTSAQTCKVRYSYTYFITKGYTEIFVAYKQYLYKSAVHKLRNIMEAQKLIEIEASVLIFHAKRTEILVEKLNYDSVKIYHFPSYQSRCQPHSCAISYLS